MVRWCRGSQSRPFQISVLTLVCHVCMVDMPSGVQHDARLEGEAGHPTRHKTYHILEHETIKMASDHSCFASTFRLPKPALNSLTTHATSGPSSILSMPVFGPPLTASCVCAGALVDEGPRAGQEHRAADQRVSHPLYPTASHNLHIVDTPSHHDHLGTNWDRSTSLQTRCVR